MSEEIQVQEAPAIVNAPPINEKRTDRSIESQNKVTELREAARAKVADMLRADRGVPQPAEQPVLRNTAKETVKAPPIAAEPAVAPVDYSKLRAELSAQSEQSLRARQEAETMLAQAHQKEANLKAALETPLEFIRQAGYTPEEWQALLLAGGKESAEMKKAKQAELRAQKAEEAALKAGEELKQYQRSVLKAQALKEIEPQLAEFPLTSRLVSSEQLLDMIQKHYKETGQKVSVSDAAKTLEEQYEKQFTELLSDEKVAKKVGKGKVAARDTKAEAGPSTLSNRVTNTTSAKTKLATLEERRAAALQLLRDRGAI